MDAGVEQGSLRPLDVSFTYLAMMGLCEQFHYSLRLFADRNAEPADAAKRYKAFLYDFVLHGLGTGSGSAAPLGPVQHERREK
jgi:hypothetical protein